jgi:hypothetical protein
MSAGVSFLTSNIEGGPIYPDLFSDHQPQEMENVVLMPVPQAPDHRPDWMEQCVSWTRGLEPHLLMPCCNAFLLEAQLDQVLLVAPTLPTDPSMCRGTLV